MKKILFALTLLSTSLFAVDGIEGTYSVTGRDPYDKLSYSGTIVITKDKNNVYQAEWTMVEGGKNYKDKGTGFQIGDGASFVFKGGTDTEAYTGLQNYKIKDDTLEGPFVLIGKNLVGHEILNKQK